MAGLFQGGSGSRYVNIADNAALTFSSTGGWTLFGMFFNDSSFIVNTFAYIYSHAQPLANVTAFNVFKESNGTIRFTVDIGTSTIKDFNSSNAAIQDQWNAFAVSYNGSNLTTFYLNGVATNSSGSIGTVNPSGDARIGYAVHGGSRQFNGRIAHIAKLDRPLTSDEGLRYTSILISPEFAQQEKIWHIALWNSGFTFDEQNTLTVTQVSMLFGNHAPAVYPSAVYQSADEAIAPPSERRKVVYVGA